MTDEGTRLKKIEDALHQMQDDIKKAKAKIEQEKIGKKVISTADRQS
jgi:hypothetical protein